MWAWEGLCRAIHSMNKDYMKQRLGMLCVPSCTLIMKIPSYLVPSSYVDIFVAAKHGQLGVPSCTFIMKIPSYIVVTSYGT